MSISERELNRIAVLAQVDEGRLSVQNVANMLDLSQFDVATFIAITATKPLRGSNTEARLQKCEPVEFLIQLFPTEQNPRLCKAVLGGFFLAFKCSYRA